MVVKQSHRYSAGKFNGPHAERSAGSMTPKAEKPHTGAVTQQDIADYCGICRASVSFALRGDTSHVPPETIKRVQAAAKVTPMRNDPK